MTERESPRQEGAGGNALACPTCKQPVKAIGDGSFYCRNCRLPVGKPVPHTSRDSKGPVASARAARQSAPSYSARFPGLIDIVDSDGEPTFLVMADGVPQCIPESAGFKPPHRDQLPFLLPRLQGVMDAYLRDSDATLFADLMGYFAAVSQLPSDAHRLLLAAWTTHTYLMEHWAYSPILCLYAVPERGKTRTGKAIGYVAYRGVHSETLQEANLFRWSNDLRATLFLDVKNLWRKAEKRQAEDILLQRFEQGARVGRVLWPERGAFRDTRYFDVFGATVIPTNEAIDHILDTRAVTINMPDAGREFPNPVTPESGLSLRERLVAFRARHLNAELPSPPRLAQARLGDIVHPLATVVQLMAPQHFDSFRALVRTIEADRLADKSATLEARILEAMLHLSHRVESGRLGVHAITDAINEGWPDKMYKDSRAIGRKLTALGLPRDRLPDGSRAVEYDAAHLARLARRYGVDVPPEITSVLSETSAADTEPTSPVSDVCSDVSGISPYVSGPPDGRFLSGSDETDVSDVLSTPAQPALQLGVAPPCVDCGARSDYTDGTRWWCFAHGPTWTSAPIAARGR